MGKAEYTFGKGFVLKNSLTDRFYLFFIFTRKKEPSSLNIKIVDIFLANNFGEAIKFYR